MARNPNVLRSTVLRDKDEDELRQMAEESGVRVNKTATKEQIVESLVRNSFPIAKLPKGRPTSKRGVVITAFVGEDGKPYKEGTNLGELRDKLVANHDMTPEAAETTVKLYRRDMSRYYGYDEVSEMDGLVKFTDTRRRASEKALAAAAATETTPAE